MALQRWAGSPSQISVTGCGAKKVRFGEDADECIGVVGVGLDVRTHLGLPRSAGLGG
jgi:hypothetical protein